MMQRTDPVLDSGSEIVALSSHANTRNLVVVAVEAHGSFDVDAFRVAVRKTVDAFPELQSCLKEIRRGPRHVLVRERRPGLDFPLYVHDLRDADPLIPTFDAFIDHVLPHLDRERDLFSEPPGETHLVNFSEDVHLIAWVLHHVAADGLTASEIGGRAFMHYYELTLGQRSQLPYYSRPVSVTGKPTVRVRKTILKDYGLTARQALMPLVVRPVLPAGSGTPSDVREHHVKRLLSEQETEKLLTGPLLRPGAALVDILVACTNMAIDRWNEARNIAGGTTTTAVTVNMMRRFGDLDSPNNWSVLYFKFRPEERKDLQSLVRLAFRSRLSQYRNRMDLNYYRVLGKLNNVLSIFPFERKKRIIHRIMQRHQTSITVTLMGVVWPKMKHGKPTIESCFTEVGNLNVTELHATGYKLPSRTHLVLTVYVFGARVNLVLAAAASHFTREEANAFLEVIVETVRGVIAR